MKLLLRAITIAEAAEKLGISERAIDDAKVIETAIENEGGKLDPATVKAGEVAKDNVLKGKTSLSNAAKQKRPIADVPKPQNPAVERKFVTIPAPSLDALTASLSAPMREHLDTAIRAHKRKLERAFDYQVALKAAEEAVSRFEDIKRIWDSRASQLESLARRRMPFNEGEFNDLLRIVHPDTGPHVETSLRNVMFRLLRLRKAILSDGEKPVTKEVAERMRREMANAVAAREAHREAKRAEDKAKRQAKRDANTSTDGDGE